MEVSDKIREEIAKQINIGFAIEEIRQNLMSKDYDEAEIDEALKDKGVLESDQNRNGAVSIKSILMGVFFIIVVIVRIARYNGSSGNLFVGLGIITGIGMAIYFFTKRG